MGQESEPRERRTLPDEWFFGIGLREKGIQRVTVSEQFKDLANGQIGEHMDRWLYLVESLSGNNHVPTNRQQQIISESESFIERETGFSAKAIYDHCRKLEEEYRGQGLAPFEFELI